MEKLIWWFGEENILILRALSSLNRGVIYK